MVICLEQGADLHTAQLMPLPLTASCFSKTQRLDLPFWYRLTWVVLDKGPLNGCVCVLYLANPDHDSDFQSLMNYGHDPYCIHKQRVDTTDCRTFPPMWFVKISRPVFICVVKNGAVAELTLFVAAVWSVDCRMWPLVFTFNNIDF